MPEYLLFGRTTRQSVLARISIDPSGCLLWTGRIDRHGYGVLGRGRLAHRVVYEMFAGPIPDGLQLDHLCRVRPCVSPAHLEPVTHLENQRRSPLSLMVINAAKTHCGACGTPYDQANTYVDPRGRRNCRACNCAAARRYKQRLGSTP